jgi:hypothetical protein
MAECILCLLGDINPAYLALLFQRCHFWHNANPNLCRHVDMRWGTWRLIGSAFAFKVATDKLLFSRTYKQRTSRSPLANASSYGHMPMIFYGNTWIAFVMLNHQLLLIDLGTRDQQIQHFFVKMTFGTVHSAADNKHETRQPSTCSGESLIILSKADSGPRTRHFGSLPFQSLVVSCTNSHTHFHSLSTTTQPSNTQHNDDHSNVSAATTGVRLSHYHGNHGPSARHQARPQL